MDIRKYMRAVASGSKAPRSLAQSPMARENGAIFTPSNIQPQRTNAQNGAVLLPSSDESDEEGRSIPDVTQVLQSQQRRRRAVIDSDDDESPSLASKMPTLPQPSLTAEASRGVMHQPHDPATAVPTRSENATDQLDNTRKVDVPGGGNMEEQLDGTNERGCGRRKPPVMHQLSALTTKGHKHENASNVALHKQATMPDKSVIAIACFSAFTTMKGHKRKDAPTSAPKKTAARPAKPVDPLEFFNNFGNPTPASAFASKKASVGCWAPRKKSSVKAVGNSSTEEKKNTAENAASNVTGFGIDQQHGPTTERTAARRRNPQKSAAIEQPPAGARLSEKTNASNESLPMSKAKNKSPSKIQKAGSEASIHEETPAPKPPFALQRNRKNDEAPVKIPPPQPKDPPTLLWVDKYKPSKTVELVGQLTDMSPYNKLRSWLRNWHEHNRGTAALENKVKPGPHAKNDDGHAFKAALLSGPPGIGKTTSAVMACQELGVTYTELNASDARNKKKMDQMIGESLESHGLDTWMMQKKSEPIEVNHVLIMDEVDGMSGTLDRAGIAELILMIKRAKIPIICICNDRQSLKVRSLANHCFDLRFSRPQVAQIKGRLMTIITREKLKVPKELIERIIEASNQDIRQCIYSLQLVAAGLSNKKDLQQKDVSVNIFEAARRLLSSKTSLMEKQELFFTDYSIMPLFVQENYPNVKSNRMSLLEHVRALRKAADSLVLGDMIDKQIRTGGSWNLLSDQAMMSCAIPCLYLDGQPTDRLQFPSWLGRNATTGKRQRLMRQLAISGSSHALVTDYIHVLRVRMYRPLAKREKDGVAEVVALYHEYNLLRADMEAIDELGVWPQFPDITKSINSKTKSALTRTLNKESRMLPYALEEPIKGRRKAAAAGGGELELDEEGHVVEMVIGVDDDEAVADEEDESSSGGGVVVKKVAEVKVKSSKATEGSRGRGRRCHRVE